ncbi:MAG: hypothetical protein ACK5DE_09825 [Bacteroidota bacterium]|jgi:hypothetical protein
MTNNKQQTAVEWLIKIYLQTNKIDNFDIEQAKAMEKQHIVDACNQTEFEDIDGMGIHETITKGEQYYKETYGE